MGESNMFDEEIEVASEHPAETTNDQKEDKLVLGMLNGCQKLMTCCADSMKNLGILVDEQQKQRRRKEKVQERENKAAVKAAEKVSQKKESKGKAKRAPSAFNLYIKEELARVKAANVDMTHKEVFKLTAENWSSASEELKDNFKARAAAMAALPDPAALTAALTAGS